MKRYKRSGLLVEKEKLFISSNKFYNHSHLYTYTINTMLADIFSKTAILALAAVASASPVSVEARDIEAREHDDFKNQMIAAHNWYRGQHSAAPLQWDNNLANNAHAWAAKCSENPRHQVRLPQPQHLI